MRWIFWRAVCWIIGVICMFSFYKFVQFMVVGFNPEFGAGFALGVIMMGVLIAILWHTDPEAFLGRGQRICRIYNCPRWNAEGMRADAARQEIGE